MAVIISGNRPTTKARSHFTKGYLLGTLGWISGSIKGLAPGTRTKTVCDDPMTYNRKAGICVSLKCDRVDGAKVCVKEEETQTRGRDGTLLLVAQGFREKGFERMSALSLEIAPGAMPILTPLVTVRCSKWEDQDLRAGERPHETHSGSNVSFLIRICTLLQLQQSLKAGVSANVAIRGLKNTQCFNKKD